MAVSNGQESIEFLMNFTEPSPKRSWHRPDEGYPR